MAVKAQSLETDHAIITMDSNETMTTEGRKCFPLDIDDEGFKEELSTTETKEQTDKLRTEQPTEKTTAREDEPKIRPAREQDETILKSMTSMACYAVTMIDIHQELNPQLYQEGEPKRGAYTNVTRLPDQRKVEAKIDYAWATMDIGGRITECRLLEDTKTWGKNITYRNYHRAIVMKIKWKGIWTGTRQPEGENYNMLGSISEAGLNMDRLDQGMKRDISKEVNTAFEKNLEVRRTILGSGRTDKQKLELLYAQFQSTVMKVGKRRLGRRKRNSKERKKKWRARRERAWEYLMSIVLGSENETEETLKMDEQAKQSMDILLKGNKNIQFPTTPEGWTRWGKHKDFYKAECLDGEEARRAKQTKGIDDRKRLYARIIKEHQSTEITSIWRCTKDEEGNDVWKWITDKRGIEELATKHLQGIADYEGNEEPEVAPNPVGKNGLTSEEILKAPSVEDIKRILTELDGNSAGGRLPPGLLKAVGMAEWTEKDPDKDNEQDRKEEEEMSFLYGDEIINMAREQGISLEGKGNKKVRRPKQNGPEATIQALIELVAQALKARNIPVDEKACLVTSLPKERGRIKDFNRTRPITVGPIIGRIINKLVAIRITGAIVQHGYMDEAQFAFLPGKSIHGAIQDAIACYEQSMETKEGKKGKQLFAIYYDISKAYDCTKWSSIRAAIRRLGVDEQVEKFIMDTLKGTTIAMKLGKDGRITPKVELRKAVKQGCPLAPILFAIVMDELHKGYRKIGGYKIGSTTISSRGYCDDTMILAEKWETMVALDEYTQQFFKKHNFNINLDKTYLTGKNANGSELTHDQNIKWGNVTLKKKKTTESIKYLGCNIAMDLQWKTQIGKMHGIVMSIASVIRHKKINLLQARYLVKEVLGARLEIGLRHADIPKVHIKKWDKWIRTALLKVAEMPNAKIHSSAIAIILKIETLQDRHLGAKTMQIMDTVIKRSEMKEKYRTKLDRAMKDAYPEHICKQTNTGKTSMKDLGRHIEQTTKTTKGDKKGKDDRMTRTIRDLFEAGIMITWNSERPRFAQGSRTLADFSRDVPP